MKSVKTMLCVVAVSLMASQASAGIIIDNATVGFYNNGLGDLHAMDGAGGLLVLPLPSPEGDPTLVLGGDPGYPFTAEFGADWLAGNFAGGTWSAAPVAIPSGWAINTETAILYEFNLATASSLHIDLGVDNGIVVWLDGIFKLGATAPGGSGITEYDIDVPLLAAGLHRLAILRADHGGAQDYDISVDATAVPEPSSLLLSAVALAGLRLMRRKKATTR